MHEHAQLSETYGTCVLCVCRPFHGVVLMSALVPCSIREDTAKYLRNLSVTSAYYDAKTRSMRDNPHPDKDPNEVRQASRCLLAPRSNSHACVVDVCW